MPNNKLIVFCTINNPDQASTIAKTLVDEKLAACVNILPGLRSIYRWKGKIEDESEVLMMIKTSKNLFSDLEKRIKSLHPYDVPEIVAITPEQITDDFEKWWTDQLSNNTNV